MIAALDVQYSGDAALVGAVMFESWQQETADEEWVRSVDHVAPYTPGEFYRRELPCLLAALQMAPRSLHQVVIDGYVWLSAERKAGLGAYLFRELGETIPVIGVAKSRFSGAPAEELLRGKSLRPLFITAGGCDPATAAGYIRTMAGQYRVPTLLKRADGLARGD